MNAKVKTQAAIILPVLRYGCENWSLILRNNKGKKNKALPVTGRGGT
jgi:hypothetical protein